MKTSKTNETNETNEPINPIVPIERIQNALDNVAKTWDFSGSIAMFTDGNLVYRQSYGYQDREKQVPCTSDTLYPMIVNLFWARLALLHLIDTGKAKFSDALSLTIPEYQHGGSIKLIDLIKNLSGIPDFYYNVLMPEFEADQEHKDHPIEKRLQHENRAYYQHGRFDKVMALIGTLPLEYVPGTPEKDGSESNVYVMAEVVKRISGLNVVDYLASSVFEPLCGLHITKGIDFENPQVSPASYAVHRSSEFVRVEIDKEIFFASQGDACFSLTLDHLICLVTAVTKGNLFSQGMWRKIYKYDDDNMGLLFESANGYDCTNFSFMAYSGNLYINRTTGAAFVFIGNEEQLMRYQNNSWHYFRRSFREAVDGLLTKPMATKMVPLNKRNYWDALKLDVSQEQNEFVLDAKSSLVMALMHSTKKAFVQMEGDLAVGLLVVDVKPKEHYYHIDIILIDQRFQGKGYGKLMVKWAVAYLAERGAKTLKIGVSRYNYPAQQIYMAAGFKPKSVYDEGMELCLEL